MAPIRYFGANKTNSVPTNHSNVFKDLHSAKATIEEERRRRVKADERGDEYKEAKEAAEKEYRIVKKSLLDCEEELVVSKKTQEDCEKALVLTREELEKSQSAFVECRNALAAKNLELSELSNQSVASKKREEQLKEQLERMSRSKSAHKGACREERGLKEQAERKLEKVKAKANLRIRQLTDRNKNLTSRCGILAENQSTVDRDEVFLEAKRLYESDVEKMEDQVEKMEKEIIDSKAKHEQLEEELVLRKNESTRAQQEKIAAENNFQMLNAAAERKAATAEARAERMKKRADMADADTNAKHKEVDHHIRRYRSIFRALRCFVDKQRQLRREGAILVDDLKEHLDPAGLTHYQDVFAPVHQEMFDGPAEDSGEDGVQREMRNSDDWYDSDELEEQDDLED